MKWLSEVFRRKLESEPNGCSPVRSISPPPQSLVDADREFHAKMASLSAANANRDRFQKMRKRFDSVDSQMIEALGGK